MEEIRNIKLEEVVQALKVNAPSLKVVLTLNDEKEAAILAVNLQKNHTLISLKISEDSKINEESIKIISLALDNHPTLEKLEINGCNLQKDSALVLAKLLMKSTSLTGLYLNRNYIGNEGTEALAQALETNSVLQTLDLGDNHISDDGAFYLAEMLKKNQTLSALHLYSNCISDEGMRKLVWALEVNETLVSLNIQNNNLTDEGIRPLSHMIWKNFTINFIDFWNSDAHSIDPRLTNSIERQLKNNRAAVQDLMVAAQRGELAVVRSWIKKGIPINRIDANGMSALHYAAQNGHVGLIAYLVREGASLTLKTSNSKTALDLARENHQQAIVDFISQHPTYSNLQKITLSSNLSTFSPSLDSNVNTPSTQKTASTNLQIISYNELTFCKPVGEGAFGTVYYGKWNITEVAIKKLKGTNLPEEAIKEFKKEAAILARLNSPYIVRFFGISCDDTHQMIITEYCPNGSLYHLLHSEKTIDWSQRWSWGEQIVNGVAYLHQNNIIHSDLACRNVLLDSKEHAKISDFGLSETRDYTHNTSSTTVSSSVNQTLPFAWTAPERFSGNMKASSLTDMYGLGVLLWEIASRQNPLSTVEMKGLDAFGKIFKVLNGYRDSIPTDTPKPFSEMIERCWHKEPEKRPAAAALVQQFKSHSSLLFFLSDSSKRQAGNSSSFNDERQISLGFKDS